MFSSPRRSRSLSRLPLTRLFLPLAGALMLTACAGGASDVAGGAPAAPAPGASAVPTGGAGGQLALVAFAVPKVGFDKLIPAFNATPEGTGVFFSQSYGASGDQSRKVEAGLPTDLVLFSLEPDVTRLVQAGLVDPTWKDGQYRGVPASSVVTLIVREGNPKGIDDWDDLVREDVSIVSPNPFSSGSAKWNLLAPYLWKSNGGADQTAGLDLVRGLVDNLAGQPKSAREATELFLAGTGDVLLSYENEAILIEGDGEEIDYITPPTTLLIENPFAIINTTKSRPAAEAFAAFLYSDAGQRLWAEAGFRPVNPAIGAEFASEFPAPSKLYKIDEVGGWDKLNGELFDPENGLIAAIYEDATA
ncbi:MAG: extracellular solute-binding protein [Sporichthyaceae bacterium]